MANGYSLALRKAKLDAITAAVGSAGILKIYAGTKPVTGGAATTELCSFTLGSPFAPAAVGDTLGGSVTLSPTLPASAATVTAAGTNTATWYRVTKADGTFVLDGTVSATGGGGDLQLNVTSLINNLQVVISSWTITENNP